MRTERVTFLTSPAYKASPTSRAAARGVVLGQHVRREADEDDDLTPEQEAEFALPVAEVNEAIPAMVERFEAVQRDVARVPGNVAAIDDYARDIDERVVRIETLIEMARPAGGDAPRLLG